MERAKDGNSITIHEIDNADDLGPEISGTVVSNFGTQVDVEANDRRFKWQNNTMPYAI
jgi:hypothetical protein